MTSRAVPGKAGAEPVPTLPFLRPLRMLGPGAGLVAAVEGGVGAPVGGAVGFDASGEAMASTSDKKSIGST